MTLRREFLSAALVGAAFAALFTWVALRRGAQARREPPPAWAAEPAAEPSGAYLGEEVLPPLPAPDFALLDQDGRPSSLRSFRGRPLLLSFAYTNCTDICPALFLDFQEADRLLQPLGRARPAQAFITLDPEHDTPGQLKAVREAYQAPWRFLTGDPSELERVWRGYGVIRRPGKGGRIDHSGLALLIDAKGLLRVRYTGTPPGKVLAADAERMLGGGGKRP